MPDNPTIRRAVAQTLWTVAEWHSTPDLRDLGDEIAQQTPGAWLCCPLCCETVCDEDCPLAPVREAPGEVL